MVSIRKFRIIVLVSNRIEYWSNYSIRFEISNIRTALLETNAHVLPHTGLIILHHAGENQSCQDQSRWPKFSETLPQKHSCGRMELVDTGCNHCMLLLAWWQLSNHYQIPWRFPDFSRHFIYGVSTLATVVIQNEMHVISHCNNHIYSHNYDNCVLQ